MSELTVVGARKTLVVLVPLAPVTAPRPAAPLNATTVSDWWKLFVAFCLDEITALASGPAAVAVQTSAVPSCAFARLASVHVSPPPEIVNVCALLRPSDEANATSSSPAPVVENAGVLMTLVVPSTETLTSTCGEPTGGPSETTRFTALPGAACVPDAGDWLMTDPDGTVVLDCVVTVPTTRPALVIAVVAAACVSPTTFGTVAWAAPDETRRLTALPGAACAPAAGFWLITEPAGTVALAAVVIVPTTRPALTIAVDAAACVSPTTFGTVTGGGPDDTTRSTALPVAICVPPAG